MVPIGGTHASGIEGPKLNPDGSPSTRPSRARREPRRADWLPTEVYQTIVQHSPMVAVDCLVVQENEVLLIKRSIPPLVGYWHLPGGLLRRNERLKDCAARKAKEETGLDVTVDRMIGVYDDPNNNPARHDVMISFLCSKRGGRLRGSWQGRELSYFPIHALPRRVGFAVREEIRDLIQLRSGFTSTLVGQR